MAQAQHARAKHARGATPRPPAVRGGLAQRVTPSPALGAIVGMAPLSRAEMTKRVWASSKQHALQDAQGRRQSKADATLKQVLGRDQVSMFALPKLLTQHVTAVWQ
jgi:chromatin remodeling complex protein RSC6